ncbi:carbohydrate ABC transporter permease, partial [Micromonospora sp. B11E3]|uniref:carbohydrate ABC transporter permease n=1 Tax=Micromonospora sp. B11E3 TaxID=3153562 RepID=UPI00325E10DC
GRAWSCTDVEPGTCGLRSVNHPACRMSAARNLPSSGGRGSQIAQTLPVSIYMLRNYLSTIPVSLEEAAAVDGYTRLQTIRKIVLPLAAPAVMANALYVFMIAWNEFLFALLFLVEDRADWTVSLGLAQLSGGIEVSKTVLMAGSVVLTLPIVIIFFAAERLLTEGLTAGADKG